MTDKAIKSSLLIVEDDATMCEFLTDYLSLGRYEVTAVNNGNKAIKALSKHRFDVAIVDLRLPGKNGIEVIEKAKIYNPDIKPIVITAYPSVETVSKSTKLGAIDYLTKPFSLDELDTMLEEVLGEISDKEKVDSPSEVIDTTISEKKEITSMMDERRVFIPSQEFVDKAHIDSIGNYKALYNWSIRDPEGFWGQLAGQLDWYKKWDKFLEYDFRDNPEIKYFVGGKINVSYNCLDRHLKTWRRNKAAIIWQGERDEEVRTLTYQELYREVCKFANVLKKLGIKRGDTVTTYMSMIPELPVVMLACARIGAIHSVVFGGFSGESLRNRILDCNSKLVVTADGYHRSGQIIRCKDTIDSALLDCPSVRDVIVVKRIGLHTEMQEGKDRWWHEEMSAGDISLECKPEEMNAEDPLFILYTSGSTGKPKGVLHTQGGYLLYAYQTMKWIFDIKDEDVYWCTADIGWVTGHSYVVYGPLAAGATSLMFEGTPLFPHPDRCWQIVEKFGVNTFYTAPTLIRALMREGEEWPHRHDLSSLRLLGTVGEPINPEAWIWYYNFIGNKRCPVVDTWWQTETGGILITPLPAAMPTKPGSASLPFPGIEPVILKEDGSYVGVNEGGYLCIKKPWPGMMRTLYGDPQKFKEAYFSKFPGFYFTGDGARQDEDGYYWLMGRIDDVINISGHRLGTAEVESALVSYPKVAEAAVVGMPHEIKGQGIYAYVTLKNEFKPSKALDKELKTHVRKVIGPIARPDKIQFADALPKTRSGKIMRRILVKIAAGDISNLGDTTTLADTSVVKMLVDGRV